jgi:hypothetical protein
VLAGKRSKTFHAFPSVCHSIAGTFNRPLLRTHIWVEHPGSVRSTRVRSCSTKVFPPKPSGFILLVESRYLLLGPLQLVNDSLVPPKEKSVFVAYRKPIHGLITAGFASYHHATKKLRGTPHGIIFKKTPEVVHFAIVDGDHDYSIWFQ